MTKSTDPLQGSVKILPLASLAYWDPDADQHRHLPELVEVEVPADVAWELCFDRRARYLSTKDVPAKHANMAARVVVRPQELVSAKTLARMRGAQ